MLELFAILILTFVIGFGSGYAAGYADENYHQTRIYKSGDVEMFAFGYMDPDEYEAQKGGAKHGKRK